MRIDVVHANVPPRGLSPEREQAILRAASPETRVVIRLPANGPSVIASTYEDARAAPAVLDAVLSAEADGADGVVVNCTADTGVEAAREAVRIPVVGATQAALHLTAQLCRRF